MALETGGTRGARRNDFTFATTDILIGSRRRKSFLFCSGSGIYASESGGDLAADIDIGIRCDQRAFLLHFTGRCSAKSPHNRAGSVPQKARSSRAAFQMPNDRRAFRLRFRDGRFAPAPFPPSLRLRFTFPFAEPQAEALS